MGIRICPRTGMIIRGPARPRQPLQSVHMMRSKKSGNSYPAQPLHLPPADLPVSLPVKPGLTLEQLQQLAVQIGKTIADQIAGQIQAYPAVQSQAYPAVQPQVYSAPKIEIDESVADVGIGNQPPLEKGSHSGKIVKEATVKDNIADSKRALKALKQG